MPMYRRVTVGVVFLMAWASWVQAQSMAQVHDQLHAFTSAPSVSAVQSGAWSDPDTWGGAVPCDGARPAIPVGLTVTVDRVVSCAYRWIRVDGTLRFAPSADTGLTAETVVVMGRLEIGTVAAPITGTATLTIKSDGSPINLKTDPLLLTRGVIAMGPVSIVGQPKREISALASLPAAGATSLDLVADPTGWQIGDEVLIAPTLYGQDQVVRVTGIAGKSVSFAPALAFTRQNVPTPLSVGPALPFPLQVHVGNLTRNVVLQTDPSQVATGRHRTETQGHVMVMGGGHVVKHAAFLNLGRTTVLPVTDPLLLADGSRDPQLFPDCAPPAMFIDGVMQENPRGRYSLHFHNPGPGNEIPANKRGPFAPKSIAEGVVIRGPRDMGLKVGLQNHSANLDVKRMIVHQIDGSGIFLEEGDEVGVVDDSLVVHSFGSGNNQTDQPRGICLQNHPDPKYQEILYRRRMDLGHRGAGIWGQGGGVLFRRNILAGHDHAGMDFMSRSLARDAPNTFTVWYPIPLLPFGDWWLQPYTSGYGSNDYKTKGILPIHVPPFLMTDHHIYAIGSTHGGGSRSAMFFESGLQLEKWYPRPRNLLARNLAWNVVNCYDFQYSSWNRVEDSACIAGQLPPGVSTSTERYGIHARRQNGSHWDFLNVRIEGFPDNPFRAQYYYVENNSVWTNGQRFVETRWEQCGNGKDDNGNGSVDEGCYPKPKHLLDGVIIEPPPSPVDCVVSEWGEWTPTSDWSACVNGSQQRTEERIRTILTPPSDGGLACPALTETRTVTRACTTEPDPLPAETCDGLDNDADGVIDEGCVLPVARNKATIHGTDIRQRIDGFGASHRSFLNPVMEQVDLLFDKDQGIGLSLFRMSTRWAPTLGRDYTDPEIAQAAQARGATIWLTSMSPPAEWKSNKSLTNGGFLLPEFYDDYATLLADFVLEMRTVYGLQIAAVSIQNEPNFSASWPSCLWSGDQLKAFVPILAAEFAAKGITSVLVLPEQSTWAFDRADATMADPATAQQIGIIAGHPYQMPNGWASPYKGIRPVWQTEYNDSSADADTSMVNGFKYATNIHRFLTLADVNAWHYYRLETLLGAKRLYVLGNFSKFIRPGWVRVQAVDDGSSSVSAFLQPTTGEFAIVVVNKDPLKKTFTLNGVTADRVTPWVTSALLNLVRQPDTPVVDGVFTFALPASSVVTFVGRTGSAPPAPVPVDCQVSDWTVTSTVCEPCQGIPGQTGSQTCTVTSMRTIVVQPANGGAPCPALTKTETITQACVVPDTSGPTLSIAASGVVSARYTIAIDAVDPSGIRRIEVSLDGAVIAAVDTSTSLAQTYELTPPRDHVLEIKVIDGVGNVTVQQLAVAR